MDIVIYHWSVMLLLDQILVTKEAVFNCVNKDSFPCMERCIESSIHIKYKLTIYVQVSIKYNGCDQVHN